MREVILPLRFSTRDLFPPYPSARRTTHSTSKSLSEPIKGFLLIAAIGVGLCSLSLAQSSATPYVITTVAGSDPIRDGGPATDAALFAPNGVAVDSEGNVYIADTEHSRIRKVTPDGLISTIAGTGTEGFSGDGGPAVLAQLRLPSDVAVDRDGNLYIADLHNQRVRKVTPAGIISTVAGFGWGRWPTDLKRSAPETRLVHPRGVAVDVDGNLYIAESGNHQIRKVTPQGAISTVAGTGKPGFSGDGGPALSAQLSGPGKLAFDADGNLYIVDGSNLRVRKVTPQGIITTVAGNGERGSGGDGRLAVAAPLSPAGLAVDADGNLYIADTGNNRIRKANSEGIITTVAGIGGRRVGFSGDGGPATAAQLSLPSGLAVDSSGNLYIADTDNDRIRRVTTDGVISTFAGVSHSLGDGDSAVSALLFCPIAVDVDSSEISILLTTTTIASERSHPKAQSRPYQRQQRPTQCKTLDRAAFGSRAG